MKVFFKALKLIPKSRYFIICLMNKYVTRKVAKDYINTMNSLVQNNKVIVYMADGKVRCGGLADRFRGIISTYEFCLKYNIDFKINFTHPFNISDYLECNEYNWIISEKDICYNTKFSRPYFITSTSSQGDENAQKYFSNKFLLKSRYLQIHLYTNMYTGDEKYGILFKRLFRPTKALQNAIDWNYNQIGCDYVTIVFRFQQLLGDFNEGNYPTLPLNYREDYINSCLSLIERIHIRTNCKRVLVTSDSITFLEVASKLDYVYVLPGKVYHLDYSSSNKEDELPFLKSFLDYYMISLSKEVFLARDIKMYHSGFAYRAALLNNVPYFEEYITESFK